MSHLLQSAQAQVAVAAALSLSMGAIFSVNVFTEPVEYAAPHPHALDNAWAPAVSSVFFLSSPVMVTCALPLSRATPSARTHITRALVAVSAAGFALFALAAPAVLAGSRVLVTLAVAALAVPLGVLAVVIMEHLSAWLPGSFGLAVALSTLTFSLGTIGGASAMHALLKVVPVPVALLSTAAALAASNLACAALLRLPAAPRTEQQTAAPGECDPLVGVAPKLTLGDLARSRDFWLFAFVAASFGATFPVLPYFFRVAGAYGANPTRVLRWFQGGTVATMVFNVATSWLCDVARKKQGPLCSGARNVLVCMFGAACAASALQWQFASHATGGFGAWATLATAARLVYQAGFSMSALLAADMFGAPNMALAFGVGAGLALGVGEALGTILMLAVDTFEASRQTPVHYRPYYLVATFWCSAALCALVSMRRLRSTVI